MTTGSSIGRWPWDAPLLGINNRDLRSFVTDLAATERLATRVPNDRLLVAESGIGGPDDVARMRLAGVATLLVGEKPDAPTGCRGGDERG